MGRGCAVNMNASQPFPEDLMPREICAAPRVGLDLGTCGVIDCLLTSKHSHRAQSPRITV
jgi:hypothetical protein